MDTHFTEGGKKTKKNTQTHTYMQAGNETDRGKRAYIPSAPPKSSHFVLVSLSNAFSLPSPGKYCPSA